MLKERDASPFEFRFYGLINGYNGFVFLQNDITMA